MNEVIQRLLDNELIDYREAYILNEKITNKNTSFENIAKDLKLSRQRVHSIYDKVKYIVRLPKCQDIIFKINKGEMSQQDKLDSVLLWDIPAGAKYRLFKYGINKNNIKHFSVKELSSIKGISEKTAKKVLKIK